jgi:5-methylcytosine-specific restriction endonuclease McrA
MSYAYAAGSGSLELSVLVLNRLYMAVHVVSARRAFVLLCKQLAEVVSIDDGQWQSHDFLSWQMLSESRRKLNLPDDDWVKTVSKDIQVPRIVRLVRYDRLPKQSVKFNRRNIFARDENRCQYCGRRFPTQELTLDHVTPRSQGGRTTWENIVCACVDCNVKKGGRTPDQARMHLIKPAARPKTSPLLSVKLSSRKYESWKSFIDTAYWTVELK